MEILYVGYGRGTSVERYFGLQSAGFNVTFIDLAHYVKSNIISKLISRVDTISLSKYYSSRILTNAAFKRRYDLTIVDSGDFVHRSLLQYIRTICNRVVNVNLDNPYHFWEGRKFDPFLDAIDLYDIVFTPRDSSVSDALSFGARRAVRIWQATNENLRDLANHPSATDQAPYRSRLSFCGTFFPGREVLMQRIVEAGHDIHIHGGRWHRSPNYKLLSKYIKSGALKQSEYYKAVAAADISICMLASRNYDIHTTRSMEIPTLRSALVAPRTVDHLHLYEDKKEAYFWSSYDECVEIIGFLLSNSDQLDSVRQAGYARALANDHFNDTLMKMVVEESMNQ